MQYDFDTVVPREGTNSVKWDYKPGILPMWIADMDFKAAPCILDALKRKLEHGVFGYTLVPDSYYRAVIGWFGKRHSWKIEKEWITPIAGLVPGAAVAIRALAAPGDKVIIQSPDYNCFYDTIRNLGCVISDNRLIYDEAEHTYTMDFDDLEKRCSDPQAKVFLLCNPQNPAGRLWTREELRRAGDICMKHGIPVISDEIHCEICAPGTAYTPFASICEEFQQHSICLNSPTKAFNIAGLEISNIVTASPELRAKVQKVDDAWQHHDIGQFGVVALEAAYTPEGEEWLEQMNAYIHDNYLALKEYLDAELPGFHVTKLEATYLVWLNCKPLCGKTGTAELMESLMDNEKVWVNAGGMYGDSCFLRINIACPRSVMMEGLRRLVKGIKRLQNS